MRATQGIALYEAGKYADAIVELRAADELFRAPQHDVYVARALAKLGRLVEAKAAYERATSGPTEAPGAAEAIALAREELATLEPRIPAVRIDAGGVSVIRVSVDGKRAKMRPGRTVLVDPGPHTVEATADDDRTARGRVEAAEGKTHSLRLTFPELVSATPPPQSAMPPRWIAGGLLLGLGGASLVAGTVSGALSLAKEGELESACPGAVCAPSLQDDLDQVNLLANVSNTTLALGAASAIAGLLVIVLVDDSPAEVQVGPTAVTIGGRF